MARDGDGKKRRTRADDDRDAARRELYMAKKIRYFAELAHFCSAFVQPSPHK